MMVEAGAKLLPEDVMAEAILFGHRSLQPHRRPSGGDPEGGRQDEAHPVHRAVDRARCSTSSSATDDQRELVVIDVETTGTDAKMSATFSRSPSVKVRGPEVVDRWSTLVNPGAHRRQSDARPRPTRTSPGAPTPARSRGAAARPSSATRRSSATTSASTSRSSRKPRATVSASSPAATSTRWSSPREGYPGRRCTSFQAWHGSSGSI